MVVMVNEISLEDDNPNQDQLEGQGPLSYKICFVHCSSNNVQDRKLCCEFIGCPELFSVFYQTHL